MITTTLADRLLDSVLRNGQVYVSLHTNEPGEDGAAEVFGDGYVRQGSRFEPARQRIAMNEGRTEFTDLPAVNVSHIGLWDAPTGGAFLWGSERIDPAVGVPRGGTLRIEAGNLAIKLLIR